MALIFQDGADYCGGTVNPKWTDANGSTVDTSGLNARTGIGAIECATRTNAPIVTIPDYVNYFAGAAIKILAFPGGANTGGRMGFAFNAAITSLDAFIQTNSVGGIDLVGGPGIYASSAPGILTAGVYFYWELGLQVQPSSAAMASVRVNGVQVIPPTLIDMGGAATSVNQFGFEGVVGDITMWIDDVYVCDDTGAHNNTFLGPVRLYPTFPNADLSPLDWTPSSGSAHFSLINQTAPNGGSSYVFAGLAGDIDQYAFPLPPGMGPVAIIGFCSNFLAELDAAGARSIGSQIGGNAKGNQALSTTYNTVYVEYDVNPITGNPLTLADFPLPCGPVVTA